jgi:aminomethyltransferase
MQPDSQDTSTPVHVIVERATPPAPGQGRLPDPLADPAQDFELARATASAYLVREGEYIQVIDLFGRQCSDFHCFNARALQKGLERDLDGTVTRTLMGRGYPGPGLFSKIFDRDFQPLVEIVRDTCGRHDNFALACTAKYYEDMGYPGHVNCSDNFSNALAPHGIKPRKGWPALNLFYNTGIDRNNVLYLDESWSRPGDYVLMRALTDLICVSSACPDDIDACNGWDPTPVHIRTYGAKEIFSRSIAFRSAPDAEPQMTKETAFHPRLSALTRNYTEYRGYWLPNRFNNLGPEAEYWACREKAAVIDLSPLRKFEVTGPDAETLLQRALTRDVRRLSQGQVVYSAMCYESGGMLDDGTLFRLGKDNFRWIGGDEHGGQWLRDLASSQSLRAWVRSSTDRLRDISVRVPEPRHHGGRSSGQPGQGG